MKRVIVWAILAWVGVSFAGTLEKIPPNGPTDKIGTSSSAKGSVKWVRVFGDGQNRNTLIGVQRAGGDLALMYGYKVDTMGKYNRIYKIPLFEYVFMVVDRHGKRKWEVVYKPDKIRFVVDFRMLKNGDIYVAGWGGKKLDVWYIERFSRHENHGKQFARKVLKDAVPILLHQRDGKWVIVGFTLLDRKEKGIVLWQVGSDGKNRKVEIKACDKVPGERMSELVGRGELPRFASYRVLADGGLLLHIKYEAAVGPYYNALVKISPALNIEESWQKERYCDMLEKEDAMFVSTKKRVGRCDDRCYHDLWSVDAAQLGIRPCGKLLYSGGELVLASDDGNVASLRSRTGKVLRRVPFGKRKPYDVDETLHLLEKKGAHHEFVRIGYIVQKRENVETRLIQLMDFRIE